ncbi:MAG: hypothetical protein KAY24_09880 [Candidatus Eisenbacteria sp.]|nr:hypothetical protein [Candidatus Eisenbacteria bacterium]
MKRHWGTALAGVALLVSGSADGVPVSYQEKGAVLTFTRDNMDFVSDAYPDALEGTQLCTVCGILGGENTVWLILPWEIGLQEYDLHGRPGRVVPYPVIRNIGPFTRFFARAEGVYVLRDKGGRRPDRLSFQVYSFADSAWSNPVQIPGASQFTPARDALGFTVKDGEVWIVDYLKPMGIRISRGASPLMTIDAAGPTAMDPMVRRPAALNGTGVRMYSIDREWGKYVQYEIVDAGGDVMGTLRWEPRGTRDERASNRESVRRPGWAILVDATVLKLDVSVRREPDDKIQIMRWAP